LFYTNVQMPAPLVPRITQSGEKKLVGKSLVMAFASNQTPDLWRSFMPHRDEIKHAVGEALFSLQIYPPDFYNPFNPHTPFTKWAAKEVSDLSEIPLGMDSLLLAGGLYAVFDYKGDASNAAEIFGYIIGVWLPQSGYVLDNRPHFELLGPKYKPGDPKSEEEIWIPIKLKI
jgi:AraC family transcriptional regulator